MKFVGFLCFLRVLERSIGFQKMADVGPPALHEMGSDTFSDVPVLITAQVGREVRKSRIQEGQ